MPCEILLCTPLPVKKYVATFFGLEKDCQEGGGSRAGLPRRSVSDAGNQLTLGAHAGRVRSQSELCVIDHHQNIPAINVPARF